MSIGSAYGGFSKPRWINSVGSGSFGGVSYNKPNISKITNIVDAYNKKDQNVTIEPCDLCDNGELMQEYNDSRIDEPKHCVKCKRTGVN